MRNSMDDSALSAKKRDKKINITDVAIKKIPRIKYKGLSEKENDVMYQLAGLVLLTAKMKNDSNEVAVTCALDVDNPLDDVGISYGDEHEVNICADTTSFHMIVVVTNQGNIHYMSKDDDYDYESAENLYKECIKGLDKNSSHKEVYAAGLVFLARCSEAGLYYR